VGTAPLWPLAVFFFVVIALAGVMLGLSHILGERHKERTTAQPFESGIKATGSARVRFDVKFYLIAVFFVVFDLEALFIFLWAVSLREVGWMGYIEILIFIGVLLAGLVYLWRLGALELRTARQHKNGA
jgi:NADH-quinone oxidoreductase subunit A